MGPNGIVGQPNPPKSPRQVSELGLQVRRISDEIAASGERPLTIEDVQREARPLSGMK
jgi:hypothetical protein